MAVPYTGQYSVIQNIALRLPLNEPPSETVPYDLQQYYSRDIWVARQRAVLTKGSRYLKPTFEIVFTIVVILAAFAVPIAVYNVLINTLPHQVTRNRFGDFVEVNDQRFWQARAASLGALMGIIILAWGPFWFWKAMGKRQVNMMLRKFSAEDAATAGPGAQTPQWSMKMPGIASKAIHIIISYPRPIGPTPYAPGAQLPPYLVNPPADPATRGYFHTNVQGVPLYNDNDEKIPEYSAPTNGAYLPHEKERFEDVKV